MTWMADTAPGISLRSNAAMVAACISIALSAWLIWNDGVINRDGVLYLRAAEAFANGSWQEAMRLYKWPLYSWLIAAIHQLSGLDLEAAAYMLNTAFFAVLVYAFVRLVEVISIKPGLGPWAALTILLLPSLNDYRSYIVRDAGYWACYLLALLFFCQYLRDPKWRYAIAWGGTILVASLFRIEGVVLMALLPFVVFGERTERWQIRLTHFMRTQTVLFCCAIGLAFYSVVFSGTLRALGRLADPQTWALSFFQTLNVGLGEKAAALQGAVLNKFSEDLALPSVIGILMLIVLSSLLSAFGVLHFFATAYSIWSKKWSFASSVQRTLRWLIVLQGAIIAVSVTNLFFLTGRYVIGLVLTVLVFAPAGFESLYFAWRQKAYDGKALRYLIILIFALGLAIALGNLASFGPSNKYIKEAGRWIAANTSASSVLLTNNEAVAYYAQRPWNQEHGEFTDAALQRKLNEQTPFDYLAVDISRKRLANADALIASLGYEPVVVFKDRSGDRMLIFRNPRSR